jgi:hypothetical protein
LSSDIFLISWRTIDMIFLSCGLSASGGSPGVIIKAAEGVSPAFLGPLTRVEA